MARYLVCGDDGVTLTDGRWISRADPADLKPARPCLGGCVYQNQAPLTAHNGSAMGGGFRGIHPTQNSVGSCERVPRVKSHGKTAFVGLGRRTCICFVTTASFGNLRVDLLGMWFGLTVDGMEPDGCGLQREDGSHITVSETPTRL